MEKGKEKGLGGAGGQQEPEEESLGVDREQVTREWPGLPTLSLKTLRSQRDLGQTWHGFEI